MSREGIFFNPALLLRKYGLRPKKAWGQNFLREPAAAEMLAQRCAESGSSAVVELGAGFGALTSLLSDRFEKIVAVERDPALAGALKAELGTRGDVEVLVADAASIDYAALARGFGGRICVAGNLPYNATGRILRSLLDGRSDISIAAVTVQREVAERVAAGPGSRRYGVLSALFGMWFDVSRICEMPPEYFFPSPSVCSTSLLLRPLAAPRIELADENTFKQVVKASFSSRRKTILNALGAGLGAQRQFARSVLDRAGIDPGCRAEQLGIEQFEAISRAVIRERLA